jgi:hypothetical protein
LGVHQTGSTPNRSEQEGQHHEHNAQEYRAVHGGFVDGSGWQGIYDLLTNNGPAQ